MPSVSRQAVSVIVPFLGDPAAAEAMLSALATVELSPGDELIVADNTPGGVVGERDGPRVVRAPERRSAYHARNAAAAVATAPWLLFTDADCEPPPDLLDRLLATEPGAGTAIVAGEVTGDAGQTALLARWARSRRGLIASNHVDAGPRPAGVTANLLVRRDAFDAAGGFADDVRSDADIDLCWRIQQAGGALEYRPNALVVHRDPDRLGTMLRQQAGYGAGRRWLRGLHGTAVARPTVLAPLARAIGGALVWAITLRGERALFKLLDGAAAAAVWWGYVAGDNRA